MCILIRIWFYIKHFKILFYFSATCSGGKIWTDCANKCPLTCTDYKVSTEVCQESDTCVPGCRCPEGMLEENGNCVDVKKCFCHDKDGSTVLENFEAKSESSCKKWSVISSFVADLFLSYKDNNPNLISYFCFYTSYHMP